MSTAGIHISGFGINVDDLDRSVDFYTRVLGLQEKFKIDIGELHEVLVAGEGDASSILLVKHTDRAGSPVPGSGFEKIVFLTDDVAALYQQAITEGGASVREPQPMAEMGVTIALVHDPDGYLLELIQQDPAGGTAIA
jgi:lactoylglutathione lyase